MQDILNISGLVAESITDGPGMRFTVFCQGCVHHCEGCHNPETWEFSTGKDYTVASILEKIQKNPLLEGVTLSGGEPFCQAQAFAQLAQGARELNLEVAAYTGFTFEYLLAQGSAEQKQLLAQLDVLVDGRFDLATKSLSLKFKGSVNQRILDVKASLKTGVPVLIKDGRWDTAEDMFPPVTINYGY